MPEYASEPAAELFARSRAFFEQMTQWLAGAEAAGLTHGELEERAGERGRELARLLYQDHLDLRAAREERREQVTGPDGIARARVEREHARPLGTVFGQVTVTRMAYRAPGAPNVHPADGQLNLPEEKHSHGLRKLAAVESAGGPPPTWTASTPPAGPARHPMTWCWSCNATARAWSCGRRRCGQPPPRWPRPPRTSWPPGCRRARRPGANGWPSWRPSTTASTRRAPPVTSSPRQESSGPPGPRGPRPPASG